MQFPQCVGTRRALIPAGQSAHCVSPVPGTAPGIQQVLSKYLLSGWINIIPNQLQDSQRHGSLSFTFASTWSLARSILWWRWLIVTIITSANIFKAPPCQALCFICSISFNPPNNSERHTPLLSQFKRWGNWGRKRSSDCSRSQSWHIRPGVTKLTYRRLARESQLLSILGRVGSTHRSHLDWIRPFRRNPNRNKECVWKPDTDILERLHTIKDLIWIQWQEKIHNSDQKEPDSKDFTAFTFTENLKKKKIKNL